jgi:hypothetical protein
MRLLIMELSLRTTKTADTTAKGPLMKARTTACGMYVNMNMKVVTVTVVARVGADCCVKGFHSSLCVTKYQIPWKRQD